MDQADMAYQTGLIWYYDPDLIDAKWHYGGLD